MPCTWGRGVGEGGEEEGGKEGERMKEGSAHLEEGGVLVLVPLSALVAGEHGLGVQATGSGGHRCSSARVGNKFASGKKKYHSHNVRNPGARSGGLLAEVSEAEADTGEEDLVGADPELAGLAFLLLLRLVGLQLEEELHEVPGVAERGHGVGGERA